MKKLFYFLMFSPLMISLSSNAQFFSKKLFQELSLRQSFQGITEKEEAAYFNIINPSGKPDSYNFSAALGYTVWKSINGTPFVEWQKNTLSDKKQDVILGGFQIQTSLFNAKKWKCLPYVIFKVNYKNDNEKNVEGLQSNFYVAPVFIGRSYALPDYVHNANAINFVYNIYVGAEYENRIRAKAATDEGFICRYGVRLTSVIYPFPVVLDKRIEIIPDYTYRNVFHTSGGIETDENKIFKIDCNIILFREVVNASRNAELKFGVNYTNGSDPSKGFEKQELISYAFKFKI